MTKYEWPICVLPPLARCVCYTFPIHTPIHEVWKFQLLSSGVFSELCDEGQLMKVLEAVDAMDQQGVCIPVNIFIRLVQRCTEEKDLQAGRKIHGLIIRNGYESDALLRRCLIQMFVSLQSPSEAKEILCNLSKADVFLWSDVKSEHAECGQNEQAVGLFHQMHGSNVKPNRAVFVAALKACSSQPSIQVGVLIHTHVIESGFEPDVFVGSMLINLYAKCGNLEKAHMVFLRIPRKNVVTYNCLMTSHAQHGHGQEALQLFEKMQQEGVEPNNVTFICILQACSAVAALEPGLWTHAHVIESGLEFDLFIGSTLVDMYAKCGSLENAEIVFERLPKRNVVTWNSLITRFAKDGCIHNAIQLFEGMQGEGVEPNQVTFLGLLKVCSSISAIDEGKWLHFQMIKRGFESELFTGNTLIDMYVKCGSLKDANMVFNRLPKQDVVSWNAMIAGHAQHGHNQEALQLFQEMQQEHIEPNQFTYASILQACCSTMALEQGKRIHAHILRCGHESDLFVGSMLISMYAKCGVLEVAHAVFNRLPKRDVVSWNALITGYIQHGHGEEAVQLFQQMQREGMEPNQVTFLCILQACSSTAVLENGKRIHRNIIDCGLESDLLVGSTLIDMYAKCGSFVDAFTLFDRLPKQNVVMWNGLLTGFVRHGHGVDALQLFQRMGKEGVEPNRVTFLCILQACSILEALEQGNTIHNNIIGADLESDPFICNSLIDMYCKCGSLEMAHLVFERSSKQNAEIWNALISGYAQHRHTQKAFVLFEQMQEMHIDPDEFTFSCLLRACSSTTAFQKGKLVHSRILENGLESDLFVANTLIDMYAKCGSLDDMVTVFNRLIKRDLISWNALIGGYAQYGHGQEALQLFQQMQVEELEPNEITFVCFLQACSSIAALEHGKQFHNDIIQSGLESELVIGSSLINMYAKCGSLEDACMVFNRLPIRDTVTWNALIAGYALRSDYILASQSFQDMKSAGFRPDLTTYLCLLSACSHSGSVEEGCLHFKLMREHHGITPTLEHYNCMIDLLGRVGCLIEAEDLLDTLPLRTDIVGWTSLLGSCRKRGNVDLGRRCFGHVITMEGGGASGYLLMSNIYAQAGMQDDAYKVEELKECANIWKKPAKAFIEVSNEVHEFTVRDKAHPWSTHIYSKLKALSIQIEEEGFELRPQVNLGLGLKSDKDKNDASCGHCEKLAVAFGLICASPGTTIRVAKNLRVCADCHRFSKIVSKIEMREVVITDAYGIHHFKDGICCCKDYSY